MKLTFGILFSLSISIPHFQGEIDIKKEWPNVRRMQVLGAKVVPATHGGKSLKEAVDSACKFDSVSHFMIFFIGLSIASSIRSSQLFNILVFG